MASAFANLSASLSAKRKAKDKKEDDKKPDTAEPDKKEKEKRQLGRKPPTIATKGLDRRPPPTRTATTTATSTPRGMSSRQENKLTSSPLGDASSASPRGDAPQTARFAENTKTDSLLLRIWIWGEEEKNLLHTNL